MTTPSPSPPISLSPPFAGERLARCMAPPAHSLPLLPSSGCPTQIQTLKIASTQALIDAVTAAFPSPPLPPSLYIPPPVDRRDDIPESEQPPRKRLYLSTLGSRYEVGESSTARPTKGQGIDYGFVSTVDAKKRRQGIRDVRVTELTELYEHDTQDLYALLEDAQDSRSRISYTGLKLAELHESDTQDLVASDPIEHVVSTSDLFHTPDTATAAEYSHSDTAPAQSRARQPVTRGKDSRSPEAFGELRQQINALQPEEDQITLSNDTNPNNMNPESIQAMIRPSSLCETPTNGDGSPQWQKAGRFNSMDCKEWSQFQYQRLSPVENQVNFAPPVTLFSAALDWWNGEIRTLGPEHMP
ncbi:hypothetical protein Tco_0727251 [Tanacetum coccineum]|uniref:Uncharacterized protein n=1 Tax=Tanacetum coccineum TaxID=301880 RepID=A0ABQ4YIG7_9ASTR